MTKVASKAEKIRRKRGRPRKEGLREPNGRPSRAENPPHKLAVEARAKMLGISVIEAVDPDGATYIGTLHIAYKRWDRAWKEWRKTGKGKQPPENPPAESVTTRQYDAGLRYLELRNDFLKSTGAPGAEYDPPPAWSARTVVPEEDQKARAKRIKNRYDGAREAIQKHQDSNSSENLWAALDLVLINDHRLPHMVGATRHLCNALADHFGC